MSADGRDNFASYLGDGVYATDDGHQIELRLDHHEAPVVVYIDEEVWKALIHYGARMGWDVPFIAERK